MILAFAAPTLGAILVSFVLPTLTVLRTSLFESRLTGDETFVALDNYVVVLSSPEFWNALRVSVIYTAGSVVGSMVVGLVVAVILNSSYRGRTLVRSALLVPWAMPLVAAALIWKWTLDPQLGVLNGTLLELGIADEGVYWLSVKTALPIVTSLEIWRDLPFCAVLYLAGLQNIPIHLYEAARIDGAGRWALFRHITVPGVRSVSVLLGLLLSIWVFGRAFTIIFLLTGGGPARATETLTLRTYNAAFQALDFGEASALGVIVLVISSVLSILFLKRRAG